MDSQPPPLLQLSCGCPWDVYPTDREVVDLWPFQQGHLVMIPSWCGLYRLNKGRAAGEVTGAQPWGFSGGRGWAACIHCCLLLILFIHWRSPQRREKANGLSTPSESPHFHLGWVWSSPPHHMYYNNPPPRPRFLVLTAHPAESSLITARAMLTFFFLEAVPSCTLGKFLCWSDLTFPHCPDHSCC